LNPASTLVGLEFHSRQGAAKTLWIGITAFFSSAGCSEELQRYSLLCVVIHCVGSLHCFHHDFCSCACRSCKSGLALQNLAVAQRQSPIRSINYYDLNASCSWRRWISNQVFVSMLCRFVAVGTSLKTVGLPFTAPQRDSSPQAGRCW